MKILMRRTLAGDEYWDNVEKKTILVRTGKKPKFDFEVEPKTMLHEEKIEVEEVKEVDLSKMNVKQLHEYAAELSIEIPEEVKKKNDLIAFLNDAT